MACLNFADSHNMVAYLEKSTENADFTEIVDILNANPIRYALTVTPIIYVSCIEQFWSTAKTKTVNNETQIHAKVEGKTIVISESSVRRDLYFYDEDEVNVVYDTPSHTKNIFANMRRQGKDFSGTVTPLFSSMLVQQADMGEVSGQPTDPQHTSTSSQPSNEEPITVPSSSQPKKTHRPRKAKRATEISQFSGPISLVADETVTKEREDKMERVATTASSLEAEQDSGNINRTQSIATLNEPSPHGTGSGSGPRVNTLRSGEDRLKLKELMDLCTKLFDRVLDLEKTKTTQAKEIANMDEVFKDVEGDADRVISAAADEVSTGDTVNIADTEVNTASVPITTAGVFLAARIQAQEQEELTIEEKSRLFIELMDKRKKHFVRLRAEDVKGSKDRAEGSETRAEGSSKRSREDLQQECTKKQKIDDDKEKEELKQCFEIVPDDRDDVTIDATLLLKLSEPVNYMDTFLHLNLKTMFEHHVKDSIWKNQQGLVKVLNWKLFDSCGVHCVIVQTIPYYLLVKKMYPLTKHTLHQMFNNVKLQVDYESEIAYELLRLIKKQLKEGYVPE
ncbi:hypothetical protein Tco_0015713 [Tanacetum coccineum]